MEFIISKDEFDRINTVAEKHKDIKLEGDKYIIRPFKDWYECLKEGRELRHAVHYYAKLKYAQGEDYLFVMRRADEPNIPFITLEFDIEGKLLLAKKLNNYNAVEKDEVKFIEKFRKEVLLPYIKKNGECI